MHPIPSVYERAMRRSRHRQRLLLTLSSLGEAYVGQLARSLKLPRERVKALLMGDPPKYRSDHSLVELGLAERVVTVHGVVFKITTAGRRKARSVAASLARRGVKNAVITGEDKGLVDVQSAHEAGTPAGETSPASTHEFRWSLTCD
jgi:predicted transcriptional regulator with HTH domain